MIALTPFIISLILVFTNILLCLTKIEKNIGIKLNIIAQIIIIISFFAVQPYFSNENLLPIFKFYISLDYFSFSFSVILNILTILFLISSSYTKDMAFYKHEFLALTSLANFGLMAMGLSSELILTLIFLEISSIAIYAMIAMNSKDAKSIEAAFKYFLLSSFMSAFYLLGSALIFGITNSTKYYFISQASDNNFISLLGLVLVLSMMFFKIAIFGFYRWSIDVYYGSNTNITGFLASSFKLAAFVILIKLLFLYPSKNIITLQEIFAIIAILSMFVGNLLSLKQNSIKKILITAGIVHSGYIFVNLSSLSNFHEIYPSLFYLCTYTIVVGFAFIIINGLFGDRQANIEDLNGLYKTKPLESLAILVISLSFIGFPYTVGFLGKLFIFSSAIENHKTYLAIFGIINTIFSVYYYLKIVTAIYFREPNNKTYNNNPSLKFVAIVAILFILIGGSGVFSMIKF